MSLKTIEQNQDEHQTLQCHKTLMSSFNSNSSPTPSHPSISAASYQPSFHHRPFSDPNRLAPEDAFFAQSPPRRQRENDIHARSSSAKGDSSRFNVRTAATSRRREDKERGRSGSRRRKREWTKLLWVKQACVFISQLPTRLSRPI